MDREQIERVTEKIVSIVLKRPLEPNSAVSRENTAEWDSLKHLEIMFAVEDEFRMEFSEDELASADSIARIADLIEARHVA